MSHCEVQIVGLLSEFPHVDDIRASRLTFVFISLLVGPVMRSCNSLVDARTSVSAEAAVSVGGIPTRGGPSMSKDGVGMSLRAKYSSTIWVFLAIDEDNSTIRFGMVKVVSGPSEGLLWQKPSSDLDRLDSVSYRDNVGQWLPSPGYIHHSAHQGKTAEWVFGKDQWLAMGFPSRPVSGHQLRHCATNCGRQKRESRSE